MGFISGENHSKRVRVEILGVPLDPLDLDRAVARVEGWIMSREQNYAIFRDVHGVVRCQDDEGYRHIHHQAGMVSTDGAPLLWIVRSRGNATARRVYGPDFFRKFCRDTAGKGYRHFFYGSSPETVEKLIMTLRELDPDLVVAGQLSPPFRALSAEEDKEEVSLINATNPDLIWVGLGSPKQERWMASHMGRVTAQAMLGVGAAFDFLAGTKPQAPLWMQRNGLEWAFRLASEPRRLAGRYFSTLPRFVLLLALEKWNWRSTNRAAQ